MNSLFGVLSADGWSAVAAFFAAFATVVALAVTWRVEKDRSSQMRHDLRREFQNELYDTLFPKLVDQLGVDDELDADLRKVLVPFFTMYSRVWLAQSCFDSNDHTWNGMKGDFEWWARHPVAADAWQIMRRYEDTWAVGFVDYVDSIISHAVPARQ